MRKLEAWAADFMQKLNSKSILSCQHCQIYEDGEIVFGIGDAILVDEILSEINSLRCPNCRASLNEGDLIFTDIDYDDSLFTEQAFLLAA